MARAGVVDRVIDGLAIDGVFCVHEATPQHLAATSPTLNEDERAGVRAKRRGALRSRRSYSAAIGSHTQALRLLYVVDAPKPPKLMKDHRAGEFICGSLDRLAEVKLVLPMET